MSSRSIADKHVIDYLTDLSNWGRWGPHDRLGTLNYIGENERRRGSAEVSLGRAVRLGRSISPSATRGSLAPGIVHFMTYTGTEAPPNGKGVSADWFGMPIHGFEITHLDALSHVLWDGVSYNGIRANSIQAPRGALDGGVDVACGRMQGRGVLLDMPLVLGVESLEQGRGILPEELDRAEQALGLTVEPGDMLVVRTGCDVYVSERSSLTSSPGLHASCLPWLHARQISVLLSDATNDVRPSGFGLDSPVHIVGITAMGLWLVDNVHVEELSVACQEASKWSFQLTIAPLALKNSTGSPVDPLALL